MHTSLISFTPLYTDTGSSVQCMEGTGLYPSTLSTEDPEEEDAALAATLAEAAAALRPKSKYSN